MTFAKAPVAKALQIVKATANANKVEIFRFLNRLNKMKPAINMAKIMELR
jgi:hypothetical protein